MKLKETLKQHFRVTLFITLLLGVTIIGITYAYFSAKIIGNTNDKSVTIKAGKLELTYDDGNGEVLAEKIMPNTVVETKTFSVKNTGNNNILDYDVVLDSISNDLINKSDLTYVLTCEEHNEKNEYIGVCNGNSGDYPSSRTTLSTNPIRVGYTHYYTLSITYKETYTDQSDDMNKTIKGNIVIYDDTEANADNT